MKWNCASAKMFAAVGTGFSRPLFNGNFFLAYNGLHPYKPAVDDLWHPLSPAHGLPRISASENIIF